MATIGAQITADGPVAPSYANILAQLRNFYWSIYGSDANLDEDTQDGQFLAVLAQGIYDSGQAVVAAYNARSPSTAQGVGLSSVVKINGITRQIATNSEATVRLVGVAGTVINGGIVGDSLGLNTRWDLPATVTIDAITGQVDVTATSQDVGDISAEPGTLTQILTPTRGWQTVTNLTAATMGSPVESDATLRQRQARSTSIPAESVIEAIDGAVAAVAGVSRLRVYENQNDAVDGDGIPGHSISVVVLGGDTQEIAETIAGQKTPGTGTYGDVSSLVIDSRGVPATISFFSLSLIPLEVEIDVIPLVGYSSAIGAQIVAAVLEYVNGDETDENTQNDGLVIGEDSYLARLTAAASMIGTAASTTFVISAVRQSRDGDPPVAANVVIAFNEAATLAEDAITLAVIT